MAAKWKAVIATQFYKSWRHYGIKQQTHTHMHTHTIRKMQCWSRQSIWCCPFRQNSSISVNQMDQRTFCLKIIILLFIIIYSLWIISMQFIWFGFWKISKILSKNLPYQACYSLASKHFEKCCAIFEVPKTMFNDMLCKSNISIPICTMYMYVVQTHSSNFIANNEFWTSFPFRQKQP